MTEVMIVDAPVANQLMPRRSVAAKRRNAITGWLFISPWIIGFLAFTLIPMIASLVLSFLDYDFIRPENTEFIGLSNYTRLITDPNVGRSLTITVRFILMALPVFILSPLGLAALLNSRNLKAQRFFRTFYFLPYMIPFISGVYIWNGFLNSERGWMNDMLQAVGWASPPDWLNSTTWIYPSLLLVGLWGIGNAMLTMLSGMQGVPTELYEAARVDGAGPLTTFRIITIPMISPVIMYNIVVVLIGLFQYFLVPYVLAGTNGEPSGATFFYNLYLFKTFFTYQDMSYGATLAWVLFVIALIFTAVLFGTAKYWVYYAGAERSE